ncbi:hypothetical protein DB32_002133 [Sandaracinus amylolyticus]|uniref:TraB/GumN family protein n=1 Tax=Sandaracinus amylolyticus TaxID=927083 RepID=A0A0F6SED1_9BACT|nr:hypothetical protein DB32_002133 [Sandaracinus amylolyticus]
MIGIVVALCAACGGSAPRRVESADVSRQETLEESRLAERQREAWTPPVLLWEVGDEAEASYVHAALPFGTTMRHALPEPHDGALDLSRAIVTTFDPREAVALDHVPESALMGRRDRLDRMLGAEAWAALRAQLGPAIPDESLRRIPPMILVEHLVRVRMAEVEAEADGRNPVPHAISTSSVIGDVLAWARMQGAPIVSLDTHEQAAERLAAIPRDVSLEGLHDALTNVDAWRARWSALRSAYTSADDRALASACEASLGEGALAEARRAERAARIEAWATTIAAQLGQGRAFVALPACDVVGDDGALARIASTGTRVRRLGAAPGSAPPRDLGRSREAGVLP